LRFALRRLQYPGSGPRGWNAANNAWERDPATNEWETRRFRRLRQCKIAGGERQDQRFLAAFKSVEPSDRVLKLRWTFLGRASWFFLFIGYLSLVRKIVWTPRP